jgi:hypothetical protein
MNKNEKYFLNSSHAALSSFQSSGRITRDIRFSPRLGLLPNFSSTTFQKNFVYPKVIGNTKKNDITIVYNMNTQQNNPLHGITLKKILEDLVEEYGWEYLGDEIDINCFLFDPSINSSLTFLRKTPWARTKVEKLWLKQKK